MKVEIEIDEDTAACLWDNKTWGGKTAATVANIIKQLAEREAKAYRKAFPQAVAGAVERYRAEAMRHASAS